MAERCGNKQKDNEVETMICPIEYVEKMWREGWGKVQASKKKKNVDECDKESRVLVFCSMARVRLCRDGLPGCAARDSFHIRMRWWVSVKGGSESSMGSTRRVPLITSSWSPHVSSLSKSSEEAAAPAKAGPPLVWEPLASVLTVMSPYVRLMSPSLRMRSESSSLSWHSFCGKKWHVIISYNALSCFTVP